MGSKVKWRLQSWTIEESQIKSSKNQDNANIHYQPLPESISEERHIYTDDNGCHRHHVKHDSYLPAHSQYPFRLRHLSAFVRARGPGQPKIPVFPKRNPPKQGRRLWPAFLYGSQEGIYDRHSLHRRKRHPRVLGNDLGRLGRSFGTMGKLRSKVAPPT